MCHIFLSVDCGASIINNNKCLTVSLTGKVTAFSGFWSYYFCEEENVQIINFCFYT